MFSNWLTSSSAMASSVLQTNTPPPDVILEIGPLPFTRFAAHSTILVAHSGYMRSALRPDERIAECPIYVPNITAEYFAPLLTYMYTGFLDLNIENIFGVLLATHVLHMPRALDICRNFLARMQADEYSSGIFSKILPHSRPNFDDSVKVIRPIASKATNSGLAFVAPPISKPLHQSQDTSFKSLNLAVTEGAEGKVKRVESPNESNEKIDVEKECDSPAASSSQIVDVDRISPEIEINTENNERLIVKKPVKFRKRTHSKTNNTIEIAKSPKDAGSNVESSELQSNNDAAKIIVDIASCDGPVRFQRVLNTAYGRYPLKVLTDEEESESHSYRQMNAKTSFPLQLAKNILVETGRTDSENSEDIVLNNQTDEHFKMDQLKRKDLMEGTTSKADGDVYICVYCNHTFKSQYCYQKHAKRHINPLSIDGGSGIDSDRDDKSENSSSTANAHILTPSIATTTTTSSNQSLLTKREVRPLDMNVQYYPCKTCGSKFPSYYFVHKHRKLCHANEEN